MRAEVRRLSPGDVAGYDRFLKDSAARYASASRISGGGSMHRWLTC